MKMALLRAPIVLIRREVYNFDINDHATVVDHHSLQLYSMEVMAVKIPFTCYSNFKIATGECGNK